MTLLIADTLKNRLTAVLFLVQLLPYSLFLRFDSYHSRLLLGVYVSYLSGKVFLQHKVIVNTRFKRKGREEKIPPMIQKFSLTLDIRLEEANITVMTPEKKTVTTPMKAEITVSKQSSFVLVSIIIGTFFTNV